MRATRRHVRSRVQSRARVQGRMLSSPLGRRRNQDVNRHYLLGHRGVRCSGLRHSPLHRGLRSLRAAHPALDASPLPRPARLPGLPVQPEVASPPAQRAGLDLGDHGLARQRLPHLGSLPAGSPLGGRLAGAPAPDGGRGHGRERRYHAVRYRRGALGGGEFSEPGALPLGSDVGFLDKLIEFLGKARGSYGPGPGADVAHDVLEAGRAAVADH